MSARGTIRYASSKSGIDLEKWIVYGGLAAALWFVVLPALRVANAVKDTVGAVVSTSREALASGLYRAFGPADKWSGDFVTVLFPDGKYHAVPTSKINPLTWRFTNANLAPNYKGDGKTYLLVVDKSKATGRNKAAFPV